VAVVIGAAVFIGVFRNLLFGVASSEALVLRPELAQGLNVAQQNAQAVSRGLFSDYLLPFEILSVILLVALVGAVVLAKRERV
jgi:NADH-quinone oxidoreductase subunit J